VFRAVSNLSYYIWY